MLAHETDTVGVPHTFARYVVSGGIYVTIVAGAVPNVMPVVAVPPVKVVTAPGNGSPLSYHVVVSVRTAPVIVALVCK